MAQPYNLTTIQNSNNIADILQASNTLSGNMFGALILLSVFIISFVGFKGYEMKKALLASSFISSIIAIFLRILTLIRDDYMFACFIITGVTLVWNLWSD